MAALSSFIAAEIQPSCGSMSRNVAVPGALLRHSDIPILWRPRRRPARSTGFPVVEGVVGTNSCPYFRRRCGLVQGPARLPHMKTTALLAVAISAATLGYAYGPKGHETVGAIADYRIRGTPAAGQVATLLQGMSLADAA